jgi:hypothetical protein
VGPVVQNKLGTARSDLRPPVAACCKASQNRLPRGHDETCSRYSIKYWSEPAAPVSTRYHAADIWFEHPKKIGTEGPVPSGATTGRETVERRWLNQSSTFLIIAASIFAGVIAPSRWEGSIARSNAAVRLCFLLKFYQELQTRNGPLFANQVGCAATFAPYLPSAFTCRASLSFRTSTASRTVSGALCVTRASRAARNREPTLLVSPRRLARKGWAKKTTLTVRRITSFEKLRFFVMLITRLRYPLNRALPPRRIFVDAIRMSALGQ